MKKTVTKKVPSHKWVVEYLCPACEAKCNGACGRDFRSLSVP